MAGSAPFEAPFRSPVWIPSDTVVIQDLKMAYPRPEAAEIIGKKIAETGEDGSLVFEAGIVGPLLGLAPDMLMAELSKGIVFQQHEQGTGEDSGRSRVTFRYRARRSVIVLDALGYALRVE